MNSLNAQQLAFILDIKKEDARARMCNAWAKETGIERTDPCKVNVPKAERGKKNKIEDPFPHEIRIEVLAKQLNMPDLQMAVDDICKNYLVRPASKKFILCDYPEKEIKKAEDKGKLPIKLGIPEALSSMLPAPTKAQILKEWIRRFSKKNDRGEEMVLKIA